MAACFIVLSYHSVGSLPFKGCAFCPFSFAFPFSLAFVLVLGTAQGPGHAAEHPVPELCSHCCALVRASANLYLVKSKSKGLFHFYFFEAKSHYVDQVASDSQRSPVPPPSSLFFPLLPSLFSVLSRGILWTSFRGFSLSIRSSKSGLC